jgi:thiamine pyrophosphate-dependent acetolactate synthase large subunit-like protein
LEEGLYEEKAIDTSITGAEARYSESELKKASELINESKMPVICAGGGVRISEPAVSF